MAVVIDGANGVTVPAGATGDEVPQAQEIPAAVKSTLNATGDAPVYACRAWVNFNGTGTVAIRASGNVSSITDNGTGDYTVNFATALQDANYAVSLIGQLNTASSDVNFLGSLSRATATPLTASALRVATGAVGAGPSTPYADATFVNVAVFR